MRFVGLWAAMLMAGSNANAAGSDRFAPGTWEIEAWMEGPQGSTRGQPAAGKIETETFTAAQAARPPAEVFFTRFYHGVQNADVRFAQGRVSGSFGQSRVDDIAAHNVPISGTYARDRFDVTFIFKAFGMDIRQVVKGRLITPRR